MTFHWKHLLCWRCRSWVWNWLKVNSIEFLATGKSWYKFVGHKTTKFIKKTEEEADESFFKHYSCRNFRTKRAKLAKLCQNNKTIDGEKETKKIYRILSAKRSNNIKNQMTLFMNKTDNTICGNTNYNFDSLELEKLCSIIKPDYVQLVQLF